MAHYYPQSRISQVPVVAALVAPVRQHTRGRGWSERKRLISSFPDLRRKIEWLKPPLVLVTEDEPKSAFCSPHQSPLPPCCPNSAHFAFPITNFFFSRLLIQIWFITETNAPFHPQSPCNPSPPMYLNLTPTVSAPPQVVPTTIPRVVDHQMVPNLDRATQLMGFLPLQANDLVRTRIIGQRPQCRINIMATTVMVLLITAIRA